MIFIKRETEPHELTIGREKYPAIYNFAAIKAQEDITKCSHVLTTTRLVNGVYTSADIVGISYGMLTAAGVECKPDDIANSIRFNEENELVLQFLNIMNDQMPEQDEAEPKKRRRGSGDGDVNWYEMLYVARKVLGWSPAEFFEATPRMYYNMLDVALKIENPKRKIIKRVRTAEDVRNMP